MRCQSDFMPKMAKSPAVRTLYQKWHKVPMPSAVGEEKCSLPLAVSAHPCSSGPSAPAPRPCRMRDPAGNRAGRAPPFLVCIGSGPGPPHPHVPRRRLSGLPLPLRFAPGREAAGSNLRQGSASREFPPHPVCCVPGPKCARPGPACPQNGPSILLRPGMRGRDGRSGGAAAA